MKRGWILLALLPMSTALADEEPVQSHFECAETSEERYRPYWVQVHDDGSQTDWGQSAKGLLGQNAMGSLLECTQAIEHSNAAAGVICSRTGLDGWKPTLFTGTVPGRGDFGYLGGSSIMDFDKCLLSTANSSEEGVCFWGGSNWYASDIDHSSIRHGPFPSLQACIQVTAGPQP